jgi:hypothetical protein
MKDLTLVMILPAFGLVEVPRNTSNLDFLLMPCTYADVQNAQRRPGPQIPYRYSLNLSPSLIRPFGAPQPLAIGLGMRYVSEK